MNYVYFNNRVHSFPEKDWKKSLGCTRKCYNLCSVVAKCLTRCNGTTRWNSENRQHELLHFLNFRFLVANLKRTFEDGLWIFNQFGLHFSGSIWLNWSTRTRWSFTIDVRNDWRVQQLYDWVVLATIFRIFYPPVETLLIWNEIGFIEDYCSHL